jgi:hypothetical protein
MDWMLFGKIVLLMVIFMLIKTMVKCLHDNFCPLCKDKKCN